jgi:hypothetical protein
MPVWTVEVAGGEDQRVEAGMLITESGALIALSQEEALVMRAWAPGQWLTVRQIEGVDARPAGRGSDSVLVGLPRV